MSQPSKSEQSPEQQIRQAAAALQAHRGRPSLLFISRKVMHPDVLAVRSALEELDTEALDLILSSPGGNVESAYLVARELRRRFTHLRAYVPFEAKSAASLICLAADELVLGPLGEFGPLDQQYDEKMAADFPLSTSRLLLHTALADLQKRAVGFYEVAMRRIIERSGMRPFEACSKAAEFTGALYGPLIARLDPARLAENARGLALGRAYASRLLRRYRPSVPEEDRERLLDCLVDGYPDHGFVVDREEAVELGLPFRPPDPTEERLLDRLALALIDFGTDQDLIALAAAPPRRPPAKRQTVARVSPERQAAPSGKPRRRRARAQDGTVQ